MGSRRKSRESALKILYRADILGERDAEKLVEEAFRTGGDAGGDRAFVETLTRGALENLAAIDMAISGALVNWELGRLGYMERAILRLASFELMFPSEAPGKAVIDEAVELAKKYCEKDSPGLVNAALDKIMNVRKN